MRLSSFLRTWLATFVAFGLALALMLASPAASAAITFDPTPSTGSSISNQMEIIQDAGNAALSGAYLGVRFSSNIALTNVYARATVGGTSYLLDATETQDHFIGDLSGTAKTSYWFINYPTTGNGTFTVQIYAGNPAAGGVLQGTSTTYTVSSANADNSASANKIVSVAVVPASLQLGQTFNVVVCYSVNSTARLLVEPAVSSAFDPNNLRLGNVVVDIYGSADCTGAATATLANQLLFEGPISSNSARATYTFQTVGTVSVALTPIVSARSGIYKYNADFNTPPAGVSYTVPAPSNSVTLTKSVNIVTNSVGNITVTYTITATNAGSASVVLDQIIDTLPSSPGAVTYTANSTTVNGSAQTSFNPVVSGQTLTWGSTGNAGTTFTVPAGGTLTMGFNAVIPAANGVYINSAIAKINTTQIDATAATGDNAPATATTRIGPPVLVITKTADTPTIINTATGTTARYSLKVTNSGSAATGVMLNDTALPSGFAYLATVAVNTPTSGSCPTAATRTSAVNPAVGATSPSWGSFSIPGGCEVSVQFDASVASSVADGTYSNSATTTTATAGATITNFDGTPTATIADNVTVTSPVLTVTKTTSTPNVAPGGPATYTVTVTNSGTANATGVNVIDTLPAGFTYASTTSVTLNDTAVAAAGFTAGGTAAVPTWDTNPSGGFTVNTGKTLVIVFKANASATTGLYNNDAAATSVNARTITNFVGTASTAEDVTVASIILTVTKTTSTPIVVNTATGTTATYTVTVTNSGTTNATGVKFSDTLPAGFTYASTSSVTVNGSAVGVGAFQTITSGAQTPATPQWDTNPTGGFTINAGQTLAVTFVATVANTVADGTYNNSAITTSSNAKTIANFDGAASTTENVTVTSAVLAVTKTTSTPTVVNTLTGTTATYTVTVKNNGSTAATGVVLTDSMAAGFSYNGGASSVTLNGVALATTVYTETTGVSPVWTTNPAGGFTINAGATLVVTFTAKVASSVADGTYNNSASVISTNAKSIANFDGTANTTDDVTVGSAVLSVTKTTSTPAVTNSASGTTASYTITVTNTGTTSATGVKVTDTLSAGFTYASTSSVTLNGASTTAYTGSGSSTINWDTNPAGGFTINAGQTLAITFVANVSSAVTPGTYNNSASATSTNAKTISNFDGANNTSDDVTVSAPVGVSLYGTAYNDLSHNLQLDGGESGTGLTLYAKLIPSAGGSALQAVPVNPSTGAYTLITVTPGNYTIILDDNNVLTDTTPTVPGGWIGTEMPDFRRTNVQVAATDLQNLNFGLFNGGKLSGLVFGDVGTGAGIANNGIKEGLEAGVAGVAVKVTNAAGTSMYDSTVTSADGSYTLWIPTATIAASLKIVETNLSGYLSTGASVGNTGGSYDRASDSITFGNVSGGIFTGVNFGDVPVNRFVTNGQQSGSPGNVVFYPHQFNAGSGGSVNLSVVSASSWPVVMYRDLNCNGVVDALDSVVSAATSLVANEQLCIVNKVSIPAGTAVGVQDAATLQAVFTYTNANPALAATLLVIDSTTVGAGSAGLVLTKTTDKATALPGDTITYTVAYQNNSSTPIGTIVISDATPAFTTFVSAGCALPLPAGITACSTSTQPAVGGQGGLQWTLTGALNPASAGQVVFAVKVN